MPNPQITFPAQFTPVSAVAFAHADGSTQVVSASTPLPVVLGESLQSPQGAIGAGDDPAATSDTGPASLIALTKRLLGKIQIGQNAMAQSLAVTVASDQANLEPAGVPVTGTAMPAGGSGLTGWLSAIYSKVGGALPAGTNHIGNVFVDDVADGQTISGSATSAAGVVSSGMAGFGGGAFQVVTAGTGCTIAYEQSNDETNWLALPVLSASSATAAPVLTTTAAGIYTFVSSAAFVRARVQTYGSGTVAVVLALKRRPANATHTSLAGGSASIGTVSVSGGLNGGSGYTDSTVALAASGAFTGTGRPCTLSNYNSFVATACADAAGTLYMEQSLDSGASYLTVASAPVAANSGTQLAVRLTGAFGNANLYRVRFVNGSQAQSVFRLSSGYSAAA
ncbi:hypothetical protein OVA07_14745 [Novosphingobium sp. SL115]|uniref:hypothetical protein n=1 Tax=Novosphingobium sp. SL115 TaxID=2995150 RepID=UPI0022765616|nr:hypothetical protein [Novosphingobium sp. SL115]MCY1672262.1 hypothetical protein [Novosphingobium sp. SL115]